MWCHPRLCKLDISLSGSRLCEATTTPVSCKKGFSAAQNWASTYTLTLERLDSLARLAHADVAFLDIDFVQYAQVNASSPIELLRHCVFTAEDIAFDLMAWIMLIEWVTGIREVVSIEGDVVSSNVSYYCQLCVQYMTAMVFLVTFFALMYAIACSFHVDGLNMLEINRVGGVVWVGRPLLFLRSVVAILFLATTNVGLVLAGVFTHMTTPTLSGIHSLSTVLAGPKSCWLVIVLTDLFMVVTKDPTNKFLLRSRPLP
ncbi:Aste57867_25448 [Aphanomyces stellatus]|uniref:Aste57867_25448 protein n=1 Tax=Aphanomyces stellatus TaxID=120398 RepID=A0A485LU43_9STRA|nr:hypothetical protein As57867_025369 [Aphanomyces stellatus]VFU02071.1 Aste57867_25448 [Aphanomyces stellatus]